MTPEPFSVVLVALAAYRITRLIIRDVITEPLRERTIYRINPRSKWRELFRCFWCMSVYVGIAAALALWLWPGVTPWLALPFAFSTVVGAIATWEP